MKQLRKNSNSVRVITISGNCVRQTQADSISNALANVVCDECKLRFSGFIAKIDHAVRGVGQSLTDGLDQMASSIVTGTARLGQKLRRAGRKLVRRFCRGLRRQVRRLAASFRHDWAMMREKAYKSVRFCAWVLLLTAIPVGLYTSWCLEDEQYYGKPYAQIKAEYQATGKVTGIPGSPWDQDRLEALYRQALYEREEVFEGGEWHVIRPPEWDTEYWASHPLN